MDVTGIGSSPNRTSRWEEHHQCWNGMDPLLMNLRVVSCCISPGWFKCGCYRNTTYIIIHPCTIYSRAKNEFLMGVGSSSLVHTPFTASKCRGHTQTIRAQHGQKIPIWVNYNNSITWSKAIEGDDFPIKTMVPGRTVRSLHIIYPESITTALSQQSAVLFDCLASLHAFPSQRTLISPKMTGGTIMSEWYLQVSTPFSTDIIVNILVLVYTPVWGFSLFNDGTRDNPKTGTCSLERIL